MRKAHYEAGTLVVLIESEEAGDIHLMRVLDTIHLDDDASYINCQCLTCNGVIDRFDLDEVREATLVEKAEYRLLGVE